MTLDKVKALTTEKVKHVELYQLVIAVLIVLGSITKTYVDMNSRISILETKRIEDDIQTGRMYITLDKILDNQKDILIKVEQIKKH